MDRDKAARSADELAELARNTWRAYTETRGDDRYSLQDRGKVLGLFGRTVQAYRIARAEAGLDPNVSPFER